MQGLLQQTMAFKKFVVAFDTHGDMQDDDAVEAFFKFCKLWKPDIRIGGGDHFDNRAFRRGASEDEKRESIKADFDAGMNFLSRFKPNYITWGNHDVRLWDIAEAGRGPISDFAASKVEEIRTFCQKIRCHALPYDKRDGILEIGKLRVTHGFAHGVTAARRMAQAYGSVLFGHGHGIQHVSIEGIDNRVGRMCGCLCKLSMDYNRATIGTLIHRHGWAYGVVDDATGLYQVWQAESINGVWLVAGGITKL